MDEHEPDFGPQPAQKVAAPRMDSDVREELMRGHCKGARGGMPQTQEALRLLGAGQPMPVRTK